ncbi:hypothetical protein ABFX02_01G007200 [Erythranthe guttata]
MDTWLSIKHSSEDEQSKSPAPLLLPFSSPPLILNFIHNTPFFRQASIPNPNFPLLAQTSNVVRELQKSIACNVDKCLEMLDNFRSQNAVLDKIMSFSSYLQNGCQIPIRHRRNMPLLADSNFAAILPGDAMAGLVVANGLSNFLNIYNTLLVVRLVLTWFPNAPPQVVSPLSTLCDPYLNIFRGLIPPLGGLDLSPVLAFLVLNAFTSTAAALPAELPSTEAPKDMPSRFTASQNKWMTRLSANKSKRHTGDL